MNEAVGPFLPDTNIFVHYVRDDAVKEKIESDHHILTLPDKPLCSQIVEPRPYLWQPNSDGEPQNGASYRRFLTAASASPSMYRV